MTPGHPEDWNIPKLLDDLQRVYSRLGIAAYWTAESGDIKLALERIRDDLHYRFTPVAAIDAGGSGVVIRLTDRLFPTVDKVLKFPRPVPNKVDIVAELLEKEIDRLCELRHRGIVPLTFYAFLNKIGSYRILPYYLTEFIAGSKSAAYTQAKETTPAQFVNLLLATAEILQHMHSLLPHALVHLDLKASNVLIREDGTPVLIDLGTCKRVTPQPELTTVACTLSHAHPRLVALEPLPDSGPSPS